LVSHAILELVQLYLDLLRDAIYVFDHFVVPEAQHVETASSQEPRSFGIGFHRVQVLAPVDSDDQLGIETTEVDNVRIDRFLSAKSRASDLTCS
jgi:hypothetical protein